MDVRRNAASPPLAFMPRQTFYIECQNFRRYLFVLNEDLLPILCVSQRLNVILDWGTYFLGHTVWIHFGRPGFTMVTTAVEEGPATRVRRGQNHTGFNMSVICDYSLGGVIKVWIALSPLNRMATPVSISAVGTLPKPGFAMLSN